MQILSRCFAAALLFVLTLNMMGNVVLATSGEDDYIYKDDNAGENDKWMFAKRYCTSFIAWRLNNDNSLAFSDTHKGPNGKTATFSDAKNWGSAAIEVGYVVDDKPAFGAVAWWKESSAYRDGHIAWVKSVSGDKVNIEEYNYNNSLRYNSRTISSSSVSGFIHFKDLARIAGGGGLSSRGVQRQDAFVRGTNTTGNNTYHNNYNKLWEGWVPVANSGDSNIASQPASVSRNTDRIDMFARDANGFLVHKWWDATTLWSGWVVRGPCLQGAPTVSSWVSTRMDIFAKGCNPTGPNLVHTWYDSGYWYSETVQEHSDYRIATRPTAVSWSYGRIDLFARAEDGSMLHKWHNEWSGWSDWVVHGGCISNDPVVASWAPNRLDVFVINCNGTAWHNWYDGTNWWWEPLPGGDNLALSNFLGANSWVSGRIDILARDPYGTPLHKSYDTSSGWSRWSSLGGSVAN